MVMRNLSNVRQPRKSGRVICLTGWDRRTQFRLFQPAGFFVLGGKNKTGEIRPWIFLVAKCLEFPHCYFTIKKAQTMKIKYFAASLLIIPLCFCLRAEASDSQDRNCFNVR